MRGGGLAVGRGGGGGAIRVIRARTLILAGGGYRSRERRG